MDYKPTPENVIAVYRHAELRHIAAGLQWYPDANALARRLSPGDTARGAGVIAALSPQTSWQINMRLAVRAFDEGFASGHTGVNETKANRILNGESPEDVLGWNNPKATSGHKVRNFYRNILNPLGNEVTIDRHAFDIAIGEPLGQGKRLQLNRKGGYDLLADIYREAAHSVGILPSQIQAITWTAWREFLGHWE